MKFKKSARKSALRVICALIIVAIAAGTTLDFSLQLHTELTKKTYRTLEEISKHYNRVFVGRIENNKSTMNVLAGGLEVMESKSKEDVMRVLQNAVNDGDFVKLVACTAEGKSCSNDGKIGDVSNQEYFQKAMRGEINVSEPLTSIVDGEESIVIAVPIHNESENTGVLFGVYPFSLAGTKLLNDTYYTEGYVFITSPDGKIVISGEHSDKLAHEKNLFSFFEKTDIKDGSVEELKAAVEKGESGRFTFNYNGERRFVNFTPSTINDWYTFSVASDTLMLQQRKITNSLVIRLVLKLVLSGAVLLLWIIMSNHRHNKEILTANQKYQSLLYNINGGVIVAACAQSADEIIATYVSPGFTDMTGYTLDDIQKLYFGRYLNLVLEEDRSGIFKKHAEQIAKGNIYRVDYRLRKKDGSLIWVVDNGYIVEDEDGLSNHSIITDITAMKAKEEELRLSENRFSIAINASSGTLFEVDLKKQVYTHFENAERIFGTGAERLLADTDEFSTLPQDEFIEATTNYFFYNDDRITVKNAMQEARKNGTASYEARVRRADDSYIWVKIDLSMSLDEFGVPLRLVGYMSDINDVKNQTEILESRVQTDPMTGLYNRVAMAALSNELLIKETNELHALIVLDIDNFKGINDTLGHAFGDMALMEMCRELKKLFRGNDIMGRMGGDEFAILMRNVPNLSSVLKKATQLSKTFRRTYEHGRGKSKGSCSMGIIMIEDSRYDFETLYIKADAALYQAKQNGRDRIVVYREQDAASYPIESTKKDEGKA